MAGPAVVDRDRKPAPRFTTHTSDDTTVLLGIIRTIHSDPLSSAFSRLLTGRLQGDDAVGLAHFFEEISVLHEHGHIAEALLFDMFALDLYWDQLKGEVKSIRKKSGNPKFAENFEMTARIAADYRDSTKEN
jgi:hypothetical protein